MKRTTTQETSKPAGSGAAEKPASSSSSQQQQQHHHHHHRQPSSHHHNEAAKSSSESHGEGVMGEFQCKLHFSNTLPLGVSEGKLLDVPLDPREWLVEYRTTALEARFKHDVYPTSSLLSMPLAFVDPQSYTAAAHHNRERDSGVMLDDDDNKSKARRHRDSSDSAMEDASRDSLDVEGPSKRRRRESDGDESRRKKQRAKRDESPNGEDEDGVDTSEMERMKTPEGLAEAIEEGFAAATQEDVVKDPKSLHHPTKPGVYALDVTPILPCVAVEGLQTATLHFDRDPLDSLSASLSVDASQKKRELASQALITRVGEGQRMLAVVINDPPLPTEETEDGKKLIPYNTVRLFRAKKKQDLSECMERPTKTMRTLAMLTRSDASSGALSFEYFDIGDIVMLSRVSDGSVIRSVLGTQGQHNFYVEEQPVPAQIVEEHDEALAALYAASEQR